VKEYTLWSVWTLPIVDSSGTRRLDDDSSDIRRLDDYGAELHSLLKEDVCYYQTSKRWWWTGYFVVVL
jgi:hypothetical protein